MSNIIQVQRQTTYSEHMYHDVANKSTTKPFTMAKTASKLYRAEDLIVRTDIIKTEITNIIQAKRHEAYAY
jgi:hypothetical protein